MVQKTALHSFHCDEGALMVPFAGWEMPLHYGSQLEEHEAVRQDAGKFDVSHMCVVDIEGKDAQPFLRCLLANNIDKLKEPNRALYGCLLNYDGQILDDLITYYLSPTHYRVVVNAATAQKDIDWFKQQGEAYEVTISPRPQLSILAVQGPKAREKAGQALPAYCDLIQDLKPFTCQVQGEWLIARTGYTGEDGIEMILPDDEAAACWQALQSQNILSIGLGARDTLRLEAGLNLYGSDMDETVTPLESNLSWTVAFTPETRQFIGRAALEKQKQAGGFQQLIGIVLEGRGVLRAGQEITLNDKVVGTVTSGSFSPTLKQAIAFARIASDVDKQAECHVVVRNKPLKAKIIKPPFVKNGEANF